MSSSVWVARPNARLLLRARRRVVLTNARSSSVWIWLPNSSMKAILRTLRGRRRAACQMRSFTMCSATRRISRSLSAMPLRS